MMLINMLNRIKTDRLTAKQGLVILNRRVNRSALRGSLADITAALKNQYQWVRYFG